MPEEWWDLEQIKFLLGHSSIQITLDRYGHLMKGSEDEAVGLVDAYLDGSISSV